MISFKIKGRVHKRRCFLFNDLILYAKMRSKSLVYEGKFPLEVTRIIDCSDIPGEYEFASSTSFLFLLSSYSSLLTPPRIEKCD